MAIQKPSVTKTKGIDGKALTESTLCNLSLAGFGPPLKLIWKLDRAIKSTSPRLRGNNMSLTKEELRELVEKEVASSAAREVLAELGPKQES